MDRLGATLTMRHLLYEREVDEIQNLSPFFERLVLKMQGCPDGSRGPVSKRAFATRCGVRRR